MPTSSSSGSSSSSSISLSDMRDFPLFFLFLPLEGTRIRLRFTRCSRSPSSYFKSYVHRSGPPNLLLLTFITVPLYHFDLPPYCASIAIPTSSSSGSSSSSSISLSDMRDLPLSFFFLPLEGTRIRLRFTRCSRSPSSYFKLYVRRSGPPKLLLFTFITVPLYHFDLPP